MQTFCRCTQIRKSLLAMNTTSSQEHTPEGKSILGDMNNTSIAWPPTTSASGSLVFLLSIVLGKHVLQKAKHKESGNEQAPAQKNR
jgi:hypothetical protein